MKHSLLFLLLLSGLYCVKAQTHSFINYTVKDGLPSSEVYDIIEDNYGYIWFCTDNGLSRFDGYSFQNFNPEDGLTDNIFFKSSIGPDGSIYFLGQNYTVTVVSGAGPSIRPYTYNDSIQKYNDGIPNIFELSKEGNLLIASLMRYHYFEIDPSGAVLNKSSICKAGDSVRVVFLDKSTDFSYLEIENDISSKAACSEKMPYSARHKFKAICSAETGNYVFSSSVNEVQFKRHNGQVIATHTLPKVERMGVFSNDLVWLVHQENGITFLNWDGELIERRLEHYSVTDVHIDREGNEWYSTLNEGLFMRPQNQARYVESVYPEDRYIFQMDTTSTGDIVVSCFNGNLLIRKKNQLVRSYTSTNLYPTPLKFLPSQNELFAWKDGSLRSGESDAQLLNRHTNIPYRLKETSSGRIATCGYFGFSYLDSDIGLSHSPIRVYDFIDHNNTLYLATYEGLFKSNGPTHFDFQLMESCPYRADVLEVAQQTLIVGTRSSGILFIQKDSVVFHLNPSAYGGGFIRDLNYNVDLNELWIGTNTNLSRIKFDSTQSRSPKIENLTIHLPSKEVQDILFVRDTAWIGTKNGLYFLPDISAMQNRKEDTRHFLSITSIETNDRTSSLSNLQDLSYDQNRIAINFKAIKLSPGKELAYRYKLIGIEDHWNYTNTLKVVYPNIPYGKYEFVLQVQNKFGKWGVEEIRFPIIIHPPFWKTWWFMISVSIGIILIIYSFFRYRILLYNRDLVREIMRQVIKRLSRDKKFILIESAGIKTKIYTEDIYFIKADGNYVEIHTANGKHLLREKIGNFLELVPDPLEFLRIRRSYIIRIDKVTQKGKKHVVIQDQKIPVGETYLSELEKIPL